MNNVFLTLILFLLVAACGGGGGSTSTSGSTATTATTATAINWTTSFTAAPTISSHLLGSIDSDTDSEFIGAGTSGTMTVNANTDSFNISLTTYWSQPAIDRTFTTSDVVQTTSYSNSYTLSSSVHKYAYPIGSDTYYVWVENPSNYDYASWFSWNDSSANSPGLTNQHYAVTGIYTPTNSLPSTGTATYTGGMYGDYYLRGESELIDLTGEALFAVNWGTEVISGGFINVQQYANGEITNLGNWDMPSAVSISDGNFTGKLSAEGFSNYVNNTTIAGDFFGPTGEEIAGTWDLYKNNNFNGTAAGYFAAKRN